MKESQGQVLHSASAALRTQIARHPLASELYVTDLGWVPRAQGHQQERSEGASEHLLTPQEGHHSSGLHRPPRKPPRPALHEPAGGQAARPSLRPEASDPGRAPPGGSDHLADVDGVTEISFDDADGLNAVFKSDNYKNIIVPDEERFLNRENVKMLVTYENTVVAG